MWLDTVVQVTLDPPSLTVLGGEEPNARGVHLLELALHPLEPRRQSAGRRASTTCAKTA